MKLDIIQTNSYLKEAWYRVTCAGGNNYGNASLSFQGKGADGKFKIGVKSKANFTKGEQVTFKSKEDAQTFAEKVLNSDVGKKRGMTTIYPPQVIKDENAEQYVEVDTVFGKAYMKAGLAQSYGIEVSNYNEEIKKQILDRMQEIDYKLVEQHGDRWIFQSDTVYGHDGITSLVDVIYTIPEGNDYIRMIVQCRDAEMGYNYRLVGLNYDPRTLRSVSSNKFNNDVVMSAINSLNERYQDYAPELMVSFDEAMKEFLSRFPFAKNDFDYVLLFDEE